MHKTCKDTTLWLLSVTMFGGLAQAASAIGIHPITLYRVANGASVSPATKRRIETTFEQSIEVLQRPYTETLEATSR